MPAKHASPPTRIDDFMAMGRYQIFFVFVQVWSSTHAWFNLAVLMFAGKKPSIVCGNMSHTYDEGCAMLLAANCTDPQWQTEFVGVYMELEGWGLTCADTFVFTHAASLQMMGILIGAPIFGQCSDIFGRKKLLMLSTLILCVAGIVTGFVQSWPQFMAVRFVTGVALAGNFTTSFVLFSEMYKSKARFRIRNMPYAFAAVIVVGVAYVARGWRLLSIYGNIGCLPLLIIYAFLQEESPHWLLAKNRVDEAHAVLIRILHSWNGRQEISAETVRKVLDAERSTMHERSAKAKLYTFVHLFSTSKMCAYSAAMCTAWFCISIISYAIMFNLGALAGSIYSNALAIGLVRLCSGSAVVLIDWSLPYVGRRAFHSVSIALLAVALAVMAAAMFAGKSEYSILIRVATVASVACNGVVWSVVYIVAAELFPTPIRNTGNSFFSMFSRVGGVLAPQIITLEHVWMPLPYIILAIMALFDFGVFLWVVPETKHQSLPESMPKNMFSLCQGEGGDDDEVEGGMLLNGGNK